ncbi:sulfurtransferase [Aeoliella sp.]|uniref:sulfurtransferase n=1 Tax=Aeoliella sp. TaxID=2795800 RepID=UPI003CCBFF9D
MAYQTLLSVDQLTQLLEQPRDVVVVDCRFELADPDAGEQQYAAGHIPGAVYAHLDRDLSSPIIATSGRHPLPDPSALAAKFSAWGIDGSKQVVAYDNSGGAFASRLWWLARWLRLRDVAVLDGGFAAWQASGGAVTQEVPTPEPTEFTATPDDSLWITSDKLAAALGTGDVVLVDARDPERYRGDVEPIDPVAGHVPGAVNLPFKQNLNDAGCYLPKDELRERFISVASEAGNMVHMCGSGVTACVNLLACEHAGLSGTKLYAGSWSEWIRDAGRAVETHMDGK